MRDTDRLRTGLRLLMACLPVATSGAMGMTMTGCGCESERSGTNQAAKPRPILRDEPRSSNQSDAVATDPAAAASPAPSSRFDPIAGDPPWVDGHDPEEEGCVTGNWCGAPQAVAKIAIPGGTAELGCPPRIAAAVAGMDGMKDAAFSGISTQPNMQGALDRGGTVLHRTDKDDDTCCYHWFEHCSGRPLLLPNEGKRVAVSARARGGEGWMQTLGDADHLDPQLRAHLRDAWLHDAAQEHASIAAFARATMELLLHAAPAKLVRDHQLAALDEVEHARACYGLARRFGGRSFEPGPLPLAAPRQGTLHDLVCDTFVEGCVGETVAALVAERAHAVCRDDTTKAILQRIAHDEASHAALAWRTVMWGLRRRSPCSDASTEPSADASAVPSTAQLVARLRDLADRLAPAPTRVPPPPGATDREDLARRARHHGRLGAAELDQATRDAWSDIILPLLDETLAAATTTTATDAMEPWT